VKSRANLLVDERGQEILCLEESAEKDIGRKYLCAFESADELRSFFVQQLAHSVDAFRGFEQRDHSHVGYRPVSGLSAYQGLPEWMKDAASLVMWIADGESRRPHHKSKTKWLLPLDAVDNKFFTSAGQPIAVLNPMLSPDEKAHYERLLCGAIDLLDILDAHSRDQILEIEKSYDSGLEFNKQEGLPPEVPILGVENVYVPDGVQLQRKLVAKAKGENYYIWY